MKVEIVSCSFDNYWYSDNIGAIYEVEQHPQYNDFYRLIDLLCIIKKEDCRLLEKQEKEMKQEFTKSDLKNFMRVKYRNGWVRMYIDGRLYSTENLFVLGDITNYNEYLVSRDTQSLDIVEIYKEPSNKHLNSNYFGKLIWERKEKSQQEIELEKLQEQIKALEKQAQKLKETLK